MTQWEKNYSCYCNSPVYRCKITKWHYLPKVCDTDWSDTSICSCSACYRDHIWDLFPRGKKNESTGNFVQLLHKKTSYPSNKKFNKFIQMITWFNDKNQKVKITTRSALIEFSHSTSVARIDARGTTAVWEYCIKENKAQQL